MRSAQCNAFLPRRSLLDNGKVKLRTVKEKPFPFGVEVALRSSSSSQCLCHLPRGKPTRAPRRPHLCLSPHACIANHNLSHIQARLPHHGVEAVALQAVLVRSPAEGGPRSAGVAICVAAGPTLGRHWSRGLVLGHGGWRRWCWPQAGREWLRLFEHHLWIGAAAHWGGGHFRCPLGWRCPGRLAGVHMGSHLWECGRSGVSMGSGGLHGLRSGHGRRGFRGSCRRLLLLLGPGCASLLQAQGQLSTGALPLRQNLSELPRNQA